MFRKLAQRLRHWKLKRDCRKMIKALSTVKHYGDPSIYIIGRSDEELQQKLNELNREWERRQPKVSEGKVHKGGINRGPIPDPPGPPPPQSPEKENRGGTRHAGRRDR